jgi:hypothetical protein
MSSPYSGGSNYGGYERARGDIDYRYSNEAATNAYGRFISQQRGERGLGDMSRSFQRSFPNYQAQFNQRGLRQPGVNSGTMQQSMNRFIGDFDRSYTRGQQDMTMQDQQFEMNQRNLDEWREQALGSLESQKANEIANAAINLDYWRRATGGLR